MNAVVAVAAAMFPGILTASISAVGLPIALEPITAPRPRPESRGRPPGAGRARVAAAPHRPATDRVLIACWLHVQLTVIDRLTGSTAGTMDVGARGKCPRAWFVAISER